MLSQECLSNLSTYFSYLGRETRILLVEALSLYSDDSEILKKTGVLSPFIYIKVVLAFHSSSVFRELRVGRKMKLRLFGFSR